MFLNAFTMNGVVHQSPGLWVRPENRTTEYKSLDTWIELAKLLNRPCKWQGPEEIFHEIAENVPPFHGLSYSTIGEQGLDVSRS